MLVYARRKSHLPSVFTSRVDSGYLTTLYIYFIDLFIQFNGGHKAHEIEKEKNKNKIEI